MPKLYSPIEAQTAPMLSCMRLFSYPQPYSIAWMRWPLPWARAQARKSPLPSAVNTPASSKGEVNSAPATCAR